MIGYDQLCTNNVQLKTVYFPGWGGEKVADDELRSSAHSGLKCLKTYYRIILINLRMIDLNNKPLVLLSLLLLLLKLSHLIVFETFLKYYHYYIIL